MRFAFARILLLTSGLSLCVPQASALSYGKDLFADAEFTAAGAGILVRNCYPNNFLKLCLGSGVGIGYNVYFRDFPFNGENRRSLFYESLNLNAFLSREFWRLRLDVGIRLGLSYDAVLLQGTRDLFYGMQIRTHWAVVRDKVFLGVITLYGSQHNSLGDSIVKPRGPVFAIMPLSVIYVF